MIGIDLIKIERMKGLMERHPDKALQRFLCDDEIALVRNPRTAAGFWAAKEACAKALGCGIGSECGFHDITLYKTARGAPMIRLSPKVSEMFSVSECAVSITHDGDYAIAVVTVT
jgi:holo-[acyl-carrier protein] synthase